MAEIKSPALMKLKAIFFGLIFVIATSLIILQTIPVWNWSLPVLYLFSMWSSCRAYYFCFYVLEHYADSEFRYTGIFDLCRYFARDRSKRPKE